MQSGPIGLRKVFDGTADNELFMLVSVDPDEIKRASYFQNTLTAFNATRARAELAGMGLTSEQIDALLADARAAYAASQ